MYCNKCGRQIADDSVYCNFCGNKIEVIEEKDQQSKNSGEELNINSKTNEDYPKLEYAENNTDKYPSNNSLNQIKKRPVSILLVVLLSLWFLQTLVSMSIMGKPELAVIGLFPIFIIIALVLAIINKNVNKNRMKGFFYAVGVMAVVLIGASISYSNRPAIIDFTADDLNKQSSATAITSQGLIPKDELDPTADTIEFTETNNQFVEPIVFTGAGNQSTDFFNTEGVYTVLDFEVTSSSLSSIFQSVHIDVMDKNGNKAQSINPIINTSLFEFLYIPKGEYYLNIEAEGSWKAVILQYLPEVFKPPYTFVGKSKNLSDLLILDKLVEIKYNYTGPGNFIAYLIDEYGQNTQLIVSETNSTSGSTTFKGDGGKYLIKVENADGDYVINVDYK